MKKNNLILTIILLSLVIISSSVLNAANETNGDTAALNPHNQLDNKKERIIEAKCLLCHESNLNFWDKKKDNKLLFEDMSGFCYRCHPEKKEKHPAGITHQGIQMSDKYIKCLKKNEKEYNIIFPLYKDKFTCGTCHDPHDKGVLPQNKNYYLYYNKFRYYPNHPESAYEGVYYLSLRPRNPEEQD